MKKIAKNIEKMIVYALITMMGLILAIVELGYYLVINIIQLSDQKSGADCMR